MATNDDYKALVIRLLKELIRIENTSLTEKRYVCVSYEDGAQVCIETSFDDVRMNYLLWYVHRALYSKYYSTFKMMVSMESYVHYLPEERTIINGILLDENIASITAIVPGTDLRIWMRMLNETVNTRIIKYPYTFLRLNGLFYDPVDVDKEPKRGFHLMKLKELVK